MISYFEIVGTTAFDPDIIRSLVHFDGPVIELGKWMRFVPEKYRGMAEAIAQVCFSTSGLRLERATDVNLEQYISIMDRFIADRMSRGNFNF